MYNDLSTSKELVKAVAESNEVLEDWKAVEKDTTLGLKKQVEASLSSFDNALETWTPERSCLEVAGSGEMFLRIPVPQDFLQVSVGAKSGRERSIYLPLAAFTGEGLWQLLKYSTRKFADANGGKTSDYAMRAKSMHSTLAKVLLGDSSRARVPALQSELRKLVKSKLTKKQSEEHASATEENRGGEYLDKVFGDLSAEEQTALNTTAQSIVDLKAKQAEELAKLLGGAS